MVRYEAAVSKWFDDENDGSPYWSACYLRYEVLAEDPRVEIKIGIWEEVPGQYDTEDECREAAVKYIKQNEAEVIEKQEAENG